MNEYVNLCNDCSAQYTPGTPSTQLHKSATGHSGRKRVRRLSVGDVLAGRRGSILSAERMRCTPPQNAPHGAENASHGT